MLRSKEAAARTLAEAHYTVEPGITRIVRLRAPACEDDPAEPLKLLEVNENTTAAGIRPVFFGSSTAIGVFFPSVIVEVTPEEYEQIRNQPSLLPNNWALGEELPRNSTVAADH